MGPPAPEQAGESAHQQAVVATLSQHALSGTDASSLMNEAVAAIAEALKVPYCSILERIPGTQDLRVSAGVARKGAPRKSTAISGDPASQAGHTITSGQPVVVEDYRKETRFKTAPFHDANLVVSGMSVPIPGREAPLGVLAVGSLTRRVFVVEEVGFLLAVSSVLAAAVDRHKAEMTLKETNQQLQALVQASPLAVIALDPSGFVRSWNPTAERIFGWTAAEVFGQPDPILAQSPREEIFKLLDRALHGEASTDVVTQVVAGDEHHRFVKVPFVLRTVAQETPDLLLPARLADRPRHAGGNRVAGWPFQCRVQSVDAECRVRNAESSHLGGSGRVAFSTGW